MLTKQKSKTVYQLKYTLLLPLVLGMLMYTSCEIKKGEENELSASSLKVIKKVPFGVIDEVPIFKDCEDMSDKRNCFLEHIQEHVRKNFKYPEEAKEKGIQGRVAVLFTVNSEGNVSDIKAKGPNPILEAEAERIISALPKMRPGKHERKVVEVPFSIPITFKLQ